MPAKHVSDRLVGDVVTEIGQRTGDPVVAPPGVLTRHLHDQLFYLRVNLRPPRTGPVLRMIELLRHQLPPPAENRLRFRNLHDFRQTLSPQSFPYRAQRDAFGI